MTVLIGLGIAYLAGCALLGELLAKWNPDRRRGSRAVFIAGPAPSHPAANTAGETVAIPCPVDEAVSNIHDDLPRQNANRNGAVSSVSNLLHAQEVTR